MRSVSSNLSTGTHVCLLLKKKLYLLIYIVVYIKKKKEGGQSFESFAENQRSLIESSESTTLNHSTIYVLEKRLKQSVAQLSCGGSVFIIYGSNVYILTFQKCVDENEREKLCHFQRKKQCFGANLNSIRSRKMSDFSLRKHPFFLCCQIAKNLTGQHSITQTV